MQKNIFISLLVFVTMCFGTAYAQPDQGFYYQAAIHDASANPIAEQTVSLRISLHRGTTDGPVEYSETHTAETTPLGLVNLLISSGNNVIGDFDEIEWGAYNYFIEQELDWENTGDYISMGTTQVIAVPVALFALKADSVVNSDNSDTNELQALIYENDTLSLSNTQGGVVLDSDIWKHHDTIAYIMDKPVSIGVDYEFINSDTQNDGTMLTVRNYNDEVVSGGVYSGINTSIAANVTFGVNAESVVNIGYINAGSKMGTYGIEGKVNNVSYLGNTYLNESGDTRCIGGNFIANLSDLTFMHPFGTYIVAGTYGGIRGSVADYPNNTIISGVYGVDEVDTDSTYAGYFDGRVYVRDSLSVGIKNPQRPLHIKDVMRLEPRATVPSNPQEGDIYYDASLHTLRVYRGAINGGWADCF